MPYENEKVKTIKDISFKGISKIAYLIGPEGGFTDNEVYSILNYGGKPIGLGPRIRRTETAGIVLLSIILYKMGDI